MSPTEISAFLAHMEAHKLANMIGFSCAMIIGFLAYLEAVRLGWKDKTHAIPMFVVLYYFANDFTYVALYDRWFNEVGDPDVYMGWYLYIPYPFLHSVLAWQIINYSRHEVFPGATKLQAYLAYGAAQIAVLAFFYMLTTLLNDYFLTISGMLTIIGSNMSIYLLTRRRTRKGQSLRYAWLQVFASGIINWFLFFPAMDPRLTGTAYYVFATCICALGLSYVYFLSRAPAYVPEEDPNRYPG